MLEICNKVESAKWIYQLDLNRLPEDIFTPNDTQKLREFLRKYPAKYYSIRDKTQTNSPKRNHKASQQDILNLYKQIPISSIGVGLANYIDDQVLIGNLLVKKSGEVIFEGTNEKIISVRDAVNQAKYRIYTDITDKKLKYTNGLIPMIDYIIEHALEGVIVEFSYFNRPIGIHQENVLIWELRTQY